MKDPIKVYIDAVWDFIIEHCDLTKEGSYFVKFHTENKKEFNRRILARIKGYHRGDPLYGTRHPKDKDELAKSIKKEAILRKESKIKVKSPTSKQKIRSVLIKLVNRLFD